MTFSEIVLYSPRTDALLPSEQIALSALKVLSDRKEFDYWWHQIQSEDKDEIFEAMAEAVRMHL